MSLGELIGAALSSLYIFLLPTAIATAPGAPVALSQRQKGGRDCGSRYKRPSGLPAVLLGFLLYLLLARTRPLGFLDVLCTLNVVEREHSLLILPLCTAFALAG